MLHNEIEAASAEVAAAPGITEDGGVHRVERLRLTHGQPVAALCTYVPEGLLDVDTARLESTSLYRMMRTVGITLHSARRSVGARSTTPEEAERLLEPACAALLTVRHMAYDDTGRAVEYGSHICRASRYAFEFQMLVAPPRWWTPAVSHPGCTATGEARRKRRDPEDGDGRGDRTARAPGRRAAASFSAVITAARTTMGHKVIPANASGSSDRQPRQKAAWWAPGT